MVILSISDRGHGGFYLISKIQLLTQLGSALTAVGKDFNTADIISNFRISYKVRYRSTMLLLRAQLRFTARCFLAAINVFPGLVCVHCIGTYMLSR